MGLAVASPSSSWRDTSSALALLGGLWLLLTSLASFGLGGYLAGRLREARSVAVPDEVEFRDGIHGLLVWGLAIIIGALLAFSAARAVAGRADLTAPTAATAEPLLAFELDRLFRSDHTPADPANNSAIRAQAARIITAGHRTRRAWRRTIEPISFGLSRTRTGLPQPEAEGRVNQVIAQANDAISRARRGAVILAFMIAASLMLGAGGAWLAAAFGGQHRDGASFITLLAALGSRQDLLHSIAQCPPSAPLRQRGSVRVREFLDHRRPKERGETQIRGEKQPGGRRGHSPRNASTLFS